MPIYSIYGLYIGMYDPRVLIIWLISTMKNEKKIQLHLVHLPVFSFLQSSKVFKIGKSLFDLCKRLSMQSQVWPSNA